MSEKQQVQETAERLRMISDDGKRHRVDYWRWQKAQAWETQVWVNTTRSYWKWRLASFLGLRGKYRGDDWNLWWASQFDGYRKLPTECETLIEFGCGPFTNARIILQRTSARYVYLSDPLMSTYLRFRGTWLSENYKRGAVVCDPRPLEKCIFVPECGDLVILINVLDHVMDAPKCLMNAVSVVRRGGWFVFGQDLTCCEDAGWNQDDPGHPIQLNHGEIDDLLKDHFDLSTGRVVLPRELGRNPQYHYGTYLLLGKRKF